jgi:hypothetical protein
MNRTQWIVPLVALAFLGAAGVAFAGNESSSSLPSDIQTYCDHGHRLYVSDVGIEAVPRDVSCPQPTPAVTNTATRPAGTATRSPAATTEAPAPPIATPEPALP